MIVIGLGTGPSGTASLAKRLNAQHRICRLVNTELKKILQ